MEREPKRGAPKSRAPRPPGERQAKPTDTDDWRSRLQNSIRTQLRAARERQGLTFDALADRCRDLGFPISRVVLSKIESGFRPDLSVPELLVLARALNTSPAQLLAPVGRDVTVEPLPDKPLDPWDAYRWISGLGVPDSLAETLDHPTPTTYSDRAEYAKAATPVLIFTRHADLAQQWSQVAVEVGRMHGVDRGDKLELILKRREPLIREIRGLRHHCRTWGFALPPTDPDLAADADADYLTAVADASGVTHD